MEIGNIYNVAMYLRLSRDDSDIGEVTDIDGLNKNESNSISSQRDYIRSFLRKNEDMELYDVYVDDGYSGANFDRPEFKRMMGDIEAGNVNCVIVKDLSRLGRDYIEAGRLIQKTFPAFCVRFIAISDHFDSLTADNNEKSLVIPVKNFVNDSYCRDISQKVKSHQKIKRENGEFIGAFAVYGYKKDKANKNRLMPDEYAAKIVRDIFAWKIDGMSTLAIAEKLNEAGILSPMEYKQAHGEKFSTVFKKGTKAKWSAVAVKRVLTNEVYTGNLVQGREEKVNYKLKKLVKKPESEWVRVENAHEAIVSKEDFHLVEKLLQVDIRAGNGKKKAHLFAGLLYCGDCEETMIRRISRYKEEQRIYFICQTKNRGEGCSRHSIEEKKLMELVLESLKAHIALFLQKSELLAYLERKEISFEGVMAFYRETAKLKKEQEKCLILRSGLYQDLKEGLITEEDFKNFRRIYERQYEETEKALKRQKKMLEEMLRSGVTAGMNLEKIRQAMTMPSIGGITKLDRNTVMAFVERIDIYESKQAKVKFRFREQFSMMVAVSGYLKDTVAGLDQEVV